jgi:hypothetical protein
MSIPAATRYGTSSPPKTTSRFSAFPLRRFALALVPAALLAWYLGWLAPDLVPVPPGVKVVYPALTHILEEVAPWCGKHQVETVAIACGVLALGLLSRFSMGRCYTVLAVALWLALGLSYYSLSAPVDRLLKAVEDQLPKDQRVPSSRPAN